MAGPNPFDAAFQVPEGVQSFVWPSGAMEPKAAGPAAPPANPMGEPAPVPQLPTTEDVPPVAAQPASGQPGALPEPAPLPQSTPPAENAPAASPEQIGTNPEQDRVEQRIREAESAYPDSVEAKLRAAEVISPSDHTAKYNWASGVFDRMVELGSYGASLTPFNSTINGDYVNPILARAARLGLEHSGQSGDAVEEFKKALDKEIAKEPGTNIRDAFKALGVDPNPDKGSLSYEIGSQTVDGLLFLAGTALAAPVVGSGAAAINLPRVGSFITRMGTSIKANPTLAILSEALGSTPGAIMADRTFDSPVAGIAGAMAGGHVFDAGRRVAQLSIGLGQGAAAKIADLISGSRNNMVRRANERTNNFMFSEPIIPTPSDPIRHAHDPAGFMDHVKSVVEGSMMDAVRKGEAAINKIKQTAHTDPRKYSVALYKGIEKAEDFSNKMRQRYWSRVDQDAVVKRSFVRDEVSKLRDEISSKNPYFRPDALLDEMWGMAAKGAKATTGEYISFANRLFHAQKAEEGRILTGNMPRQEVISTLNKMRDIAYEAIARTLPGDDALALARAYSQKHHDIFSRGVLSKVTAENKLGEGAVRPEATMDYITSKFNGFKDLLENTRRLMREPPAPGQRITTANITPGGKMMAANASERQALIKTRADASNAIRAKIREAIADAGFDQKTALRVMQKAEHDVPRGAAVATDLKKAIPSLQEALQEQQVVQRGAFSRVLGSFNGQISRNPADAVRMVFREGAPLASQLMVRMRENPMALDHFRQSLITELLQRSKGKPGELDTMLKSEHVKRLFAATMDSDTMGRINRVSDVISRIEKGDINLAGKYFVTPTILASRFGGAAFGRMMGNMTGGSTLQGVSVWSQYFKGLATETMGKLTKPEILLAKAMVDPHWEKFVLSQDPTSARGAQRLVKSTQRLTRIMEAGRIYENATDNPVTQKRRNEQ